VVKISSIIAYMIRMTTTFKATEMYLLYYISAVNTQQIQRPDILVQLGYIWRHVSAVNRPSSGQQVIVLFRYIQTAYPMGSHCLH